MLTARPFVVCLAALVPLASLAGCGDDERGLAVAPASSVGGARPGADTGKGPSVSSTADGPSVQPGPLNPRVGDGSVVTTPFDAAFHAVTGVECASSGIDSVSVQLPITQFQFSTCHVVLEKTSAVTGALTVDALGATPSDPWTTAVEAVMGSPGRVDVTFAHARTGFDW